MANQDPSPQPAAAAVEPAEHGDAASSTGPAAVDPTGPFWVMVERPGFDPDVAAGPYPTFALAVQACDHSALVEELVWQPYTDCYVTDTPPAAGVDRIRVDLDDRDHTG